MLPVDQRSASASRLACPHRHAGAGSLAAPFGLARPTIRDYLTLLERVYRVEELPAWQSNHLNRLVKSPTLHMGDTGLRRLRQVTGSRFKAGVVLYDGETCLGFGDRLFAVPVRALWESAPTSRPGVAPA